MTPEKEGRRSLRTTDVPAAGLADPATPPTVPTMKRAVEPDVLTVAQLAGRLQLSEHGTRNLIDRGDVPGVIRLGRRIRISKTAVDRWLGGTEPGRAS